MTSEIDTQQFADGVVVFVAVEAMKRCLVCQLVDVEHFRDALALALLLFANVSHGS